MYTTNGFHREVAVIAPLSHLDMCEDNNVFLALQQYMDRYSYVVFHQRQACQGKWIILDNGVLEGNAEIHMDKLTSMAYNIGASEIILPDAFKIATSTTLQGSIDALSPGAKQDFQYMIVPHGDGISYESYLADYMKCVEIADVNDITYRIGVAYREFGTRPWRLDHAFVNNRNVHWLGCMYPVEIVSGEFASLDTSLPFRCACDGDMLCANTKHFNFDMMMNESQRTTAISNISQIRTWSKDMTNRIHPCRNT